jgi:hypothetical protein
MTKNNRAQTAEVTPQTRNALRVVTIILGLVVTLDLFYFALAFTTGGWQLFVWAGEIFALIVVSLISIWLIRRGRPVLAIWLTFGGVAVVAPLAMLSIAGLGLAGGLSCALVLSQVAVQTLPPKQIGWGVTASVVVGVAVLLVDVFGPADRLTAPFAMMTFVPIIVASSRSSHWACWPS